MIRTLYFLNYKNKDSRQYVELYFNLQAKKPTTNNKELKLNEIKILFGVMNLTFWLSAFRMHIKFYVCSSLQPIYKTVLVVIAFVGAKGTKKIVERFYFTPLCIPCYLCAIFKWSVVVCRLCVCVWPLILFKKWLKCKKKTIKFWFKKFEIQKKNVFVQKIEKQHQNSLINIYNNKRIELNRIEYEMSLSVKTTHK